MAYAPEADYSGTDRFTYVVSDGNGGTSTAAVVVTVLPVNDAPMAVGVIPDQVLDEAGEETTVELGPFFQDTDEDALTYRASSSDLSVATAAGFVGDADAGAGGVRERDGDGDRGGCGRPDGDADLHRGSERPAGAQGRVGHAGGDRAVAPGERADDTGPAGDGGWHGRVAADGAGARGAAGEDGGAQGGRTDTGELAVIVDRPVRGAWAAHRGWARLRAQRSARRRHRQRRRV